MSTITYESGLEMVEFHVKLGKIRFFIRKSRVHSIVSGSGLQCVKRLSYNWLTHGVVPLTLVSACELRSIIRFSTKKVANAAQIQDNLQ